MYIYVLMDILQITQLGTAFQNAQKTYLHKPLIEHVQDFVHPVITQTIRLDIADLYAIIVLHYGVTILHGLVFWLVHLSQIYMQTPILINANFNVPVDYLLIKWQESV